MLKLNIFMIDTVAIVLEAMPFLLIGSILGSIIEIYLPEKLFQNRIFRQKRTGFLLMLIMGMILPTCECGVIPIAKKLVKKGLPPYLSVVYLFSAPVINPIVIAATYVAFRFNVWMVLGRIGITALTAVTVALVLSRQKGIYLEDGHQESGEHHHHRHEGCDCENHQKASGFRERFLFIVRHSAVEFLEMSKYLILGALFAAAFRIFVPKDVLYFFEPNAVLSILFMMVLAVLLSICSEADAFVASSFMRFTPFAQLAFVTIGPVVDLKLLWMYSGTFKKKAILLMTVLPFALIFILNSILEMIVRKL